MSERFHEGRAALITGGASGQGRAIALALAEAGADVAIGSYIAERHGAVQREADTSHPSQQALDDTVAAIEQRGVRALGCDHDAREDASCRALYDAALEAFGKVDILVNVAGKTIEHAFADFPDAAWHDVIDTNLNGYYRMSRLAFGPMCERGWGRIVNIASTAANVGAPLNAAYCASKAGILGLTRCVAIEGGPHGVTCNAINPGFVDTEMVHRNFERAAAREGKGRTAAEMLAEAVAGYPQHRMIAPEEIATLTVFLTRDEAVAISGEDVTVSTGALW